MQKRFLNHLLLCSLFAISLFSFACSDRVAPSQHEDQPADNKIVMVKDIDGNVYQTVKIVTQLWMAENLRVTHFRNGEAITNVTDDAAWRTQITEAYCTYDDSVDNTEIYGLLYNWYAVNDSRNIAPFGWHVPSDEEWQILIYHLGGSSIAGDKMKNAEGWFDNGNGSNSSEFTALPGGIRYSDGLYDGIGSSASFWSSTGFSSDGAWNRLISYVGPGIGRDGGNKLDGISVRCVRD